MHQNVEPVVAIVVAAGSGSRLGAALPKALVPLDGTALVRRCIDNLALAGVQQVMVTIPVGHLSQFEEALEGTTVAVRCVVGGARRQDSVQCALRALDGVSDETIVLVHDAARPLAPAAVAKRVVAAVRAGAPAVVPTLPVVDSVRRVTPTSSVVVDRAELRVVQTPQGFRCGILADAYAHVAAHDMDVTDDASACESSGVAVRLVDGDRRGLKITEPIDLVLASALLAEEELG